MIPLPSSADGVEKDSVSDEAPPTAVPTNDSLSRKPDTKSYGEGLSPGLLDVPPAGGFRASSPALSLLSVEDYPSAPTGRPSSFPPPPPGPQIASSHPAEASPRTRRGRLEAFWLHNKGLVLVLVSQFFGVAMNVTTRILEVEGNDGKGYHPFQVLFARMGITLVLSSLYVWWKKVEHAPLGQKDVRWLLALRGFGGFFGVFGMYYSLLYLPLSDATVITFLAPSLACFACSILINEPFTRMEQIAALISLAGVVLIARPTSLFSTPSVPNATTAPNAPTGPYTAATPHQRAVAVAAALLGVLGAATAYTTLRWIGRRAHALISVNYFAAWSTLVSAAAMAFAPRVPAAAPASPRDWGLLALLGACGFVMQYLLAAGLQQERSGRATNMVYCQMLFALAADKVVFGAVPDAWGWAGSSLILGSAVYVAVRKVRGAEVGDEERGLVEGMERGGEGEESGDEEEEEGAVRLEAVRA